MSTKTQKKSRLELKTETIKKSKTSPEKLVFKFAVKTKKGISFDLKIQGPKLIIEEEFKDFDWSVDNKSQIDVLIGEKIINVSYMSAIKDEMEKMLNLNTGVDLI